MTKKNNKINTETGIQVRTEMQKALDKINDKLNHIKTITTSPYKTNGNFKFNEYGTEGTVNIQSITDITYGIKALSLLRRHRDSYNEAASQELELKSFPAFKFFAYDYDAWAHDIKLRLSILMQAETVKNLQAAKVKLESFLTEEDRLALTLQEISDWTK